jgi:hypothetical protein
MLNSTTDQQLLNSPQQTQQLLNSTTDSATAEFSQQTPQLLNLHNRLDVNSDIALVVGAGSLINYFKAFASKSFFLFQISLHRWRALLGVALFAVGNLSDLDRCSGSLSLNKILAGLLAKTLERFDFLVLVQRYIFFGVPSSSSTW